MGEQQHTLNDTAKLAELIKGMRVAMFHTFSDVHSGPSASTVHARPMHTQRIDPGAFAGELWFFTNSDSEKVREIDRNPRVMLSYADNSSSNYVVAWGEARCERDPAKARELWNIHAKGWWPEGPGSAELTLISVRLTSAEYWDGPSNVSYMLKLAKAVATGERIKTYGEHGVVTNP